MNAHYFLAAACPALAAMIRSDFLRRGIGTVWLVLFGVCHLSYALMLAGGKTVAASVALNLVVVGLMFSFLKGYAGFIRRSSVPSGTMVGKGDWWFLGTLAPGFAPEEYVRFLTLSFALTWVGWKRYAVFRPRTSTVPLVGTVGICFLFYVFIRALK